MSDKPKAERPERRRLPDGFGLIVKFLSGPEEGRMVPILYSRTTLGRKFGDLIVRDTKVSGTHASIELQRGKFRVVDLGSSNGTFVKGEQVKEGMVEPGEEIQIGLTTMTLVIDPSHAARLLSERPPTVTREAGGLKDMLEREVFQASVATQMVDGPGKKKKTICLLVIEGPQKGKQFDFMESRFVIGRVGADLNLSDHDVSRKHALVERDSSGQIILRDLASGNGTFLNTRRITNAVLSEGDRIQVGSSILQFSEVVLKG